jgi:hypothetical protein
VDFQSGDQYDHQKNAANAEEYAPAAQILTNQADSMHALMAEMKKMVHGKSHEQSAITSR